jgi:hypothetical protein
MAPIINDTTEATFEIEQKGKWTDSKTSRAVYTLSPLSILTLGFSRIPPFFGR